MAVACSPVSQLPTAIPSDDLGPKLPKNGAFKRSISYQLQRAQQKPTENQSFVQFGS